MLQVENICKSCILFNQFILHLAPGQLIIGGWNDGILSSVELFPRPPSDACSIPDLPQGRRGHSLSLLSGGRLVVCGGHNGPSFFDSCIYWVAGNTSWTHFTTMRCLLIILTSHNHLHQTQSQCGERISHGVDAAFSSRLHCAARRRWQCSKTHCRDGAR